jgi:integrase
MAKRRSNGEGTITQRKCDGRWEARLFLGYIGGKRKWKFLHAATKEVAVKKLREAQVQHARGVNVAPERQTLEQFLWRWHEEVVKLRNRPKTILSYEQLIRVHLVPSLGRFTLQKLSPQDVQMFLNERYRSGLSPRTVQYLRGVLRCALNDALRWDLVHRNVATLAQPPKGQRKEMTALGPEEVKRFLIAAEGHRLEGFFALLMATGIRLGEALGLKWEDVDFDKATLTVRKQLQRLKGSVSLIDPKTDRALRTIPIAPFAIEALRGHRSRQLEERLRNAGKWEDQGFVFCTQVGTPADERKIRNGLREILNSAGLPKMRVHDLRHTCATLLLSRNVNPRVVQEVLGHSNISLTLGTYSHVLPTLAREAADQMQAAVAGSPRPTALRPSGSFLARP